MNDVAIFLIGVGMTLVFALLVVAYLRPHLQRILVDLCGNEERARFWAAFSNVILLLTPLIGAMSYRPRIGELSPVFFELSTQFKWGLVGLVVALAVMGVVISRFVPLPVISPTHRETSTGPMPK